MNHGLPQRMRAVEISEAGPPDVLRVTRLERPEPRRHEVLVRVHAAGVNRPDVLQRLGLYPLPADADPLPGLEIAGVVVATGTGATRWSVGDRLMALTSGGGYAEYCRVHEDHCLKIPNGLDMVHAAGIPETFFTVNYNVFMRAGLRAGECLLVHGGSSGIGTAAIQMAKSAGCRVIVTAGSDEKCEFCRTLGADLAVNYRNADWVHAAREFTGDQGVDVVLDMVAGDYVQKNLDCLGLEGRYAIIAFLHGARAEVNLKPVLARRLTITGSTLRPQSSVEKAAITQDLERRFGRQIGAGSIKPVVHRTFPLEAAADAHRLMESSAHMGKIILTLTDD
jgi:putative PIG3 family NAD(P)H quinone oxidoreductase